MLAATLGTEEPYAEKEEGLKIKDATSQKANGIQKEDISFIYLTQTNSVHCLEVIR